MAKNSPFLLLLALLMGCAQVGNVTGGEKDTRAPELIGADPPNGSVRFKSEVIRLEFDERIQLERVRERLLISPPLEEAPEVRITGTRNVEIRLAGPLLPNTTYTFNLGECVKDLTEGNVATGASYICSTGEVLDSLRVAGAVVNAYTGVPEKGILVLLYAEGDTTAFRTGRPRSMTRCNAMGVFELSNLPEGRFDLYALLDRNANYKYDLPNEEIAFLDSALVLNANDSVAPIVSMRSFVPLSASQQVRSSKVLPDGAMELVLARPGDTIMVRDITRSGGSPSWVPEWSTTRDTVLLWPSDTTQLASGSYEIRDRSMVLDTLRYRTVQQMPFYNKLKATQTEDGAEALVQIRSARPIARMDSARIRLVRDSVPLEFRITRIANDRRTITLRTDLAPGASGRLTILPKAVHDIYGGTNDTLQVPLGRAADRAVGSLRVNLNELDGPGPFVLQLVDQQQRILRETATEKNIAFVVWDRLPPGHFTLRLIADRNGNGRWDTGEWGDRRQAERTWYHPEPVNVRAAWDVVVDWTVP